MNTKQEAMELLLVPPPPFREIESYALAAHSTLEKELVRALHEARMLVEQAVTEACLAAHGCEPSADDLAAFIVLGRERLAKQLGR